MMMKLITLAAGLLLFSAIAHAGDTIEGCETGDVVPGKGWVYKKVPCSDLDRKIPCTREWTDEKGYWHSEETQCASGTKQKTVQQVRREEDAAKKKKCGKDYMELRVGMSLARFEECYEALSYVTETVGKQGVTETYRATFYYVHARDGKIVSYTRRTN